MTADNNLEKELKRDATMHRAYMLDVFGVEPLGIKNTPSRIRRKNLSPQDQMHQVLESLQRLTRSLQPQKDTSLSEDKSSD